MKKKMLVSSVVVMQTLCVSIFRTTRSVLAAEAISAFPGAGGAVMYGTEAEVKDGNTNGKAERKICRKDDRRMQTGYEKTVSGG
ncbi:MAG: hypothetical protein J1F64_06590 [Oscillospiraceae bacterium]|nr:hypothetical protein [Oscillospiraceae bacterium]